MGICGSTEQRDTPESAKSRELDRQLREDEKRQTKEVKLLLLGAGESGKSTILKSMRLIHNIPFTPVERENYRRLVFANVVSGVRQLLEAMEEWGTGFDDPSLANHLNLFVSYPDIAEGEPFPQSYYEPLLQLWNDGGVQRAHSKAHEIALPDNLDYYFGNIDRLFEPHYQPSDADILHCRNKTTGIIETIFPIADRMYRIFDVGGQRSERKKWIHCFEGVTAVLFIVALSGYDCCLVEDKDSNQTQEALMLFDSICNSKWFLRTSMILFLNKVDIFSAKVMISPISQYFPDYEGEESDVEGGKVYFKNRFVRLNRSQTKEVYPSFTNATDPVLLKLVMASVTDIILTSSLRDNLL